MGDLIGGDHRQNDIQLPTAEQKGQWVFHGVLTKWTTAQGLTHVLWSSHKTNYKNKLEAGHSKHLMNIPQNGTKWKLYCYVVSSLQAD
jgi:hypothetical protein